MKSKLSYQIFRRQFWGIAAFGFLIITLQIGLYSLRNQPQKNIDIKFIVDGGKPIQALTEFNPNELSKEEWIGLGFSEKQSETILRYKQYLGGSFSSKEQFGKCFAVSKEKFEILKNYILLPDFGINKQNETKNFSHQKTFGLKINGRFNPDAYSAQDWRNMGFSENQANAILKYKNYLGGSFVSKEKFKECFIISEENYKKLGPYLILPEKTPENFSRNYSRENIDKPRRSYSYFDPNTTDLEGWKSLGFSEKQAQVIINYRDRNLRGSFKSLEDIEKCFVISTEKFNEIKPYIKLAPEKLATKPMEVSEIKKNTPVEKTDFGKINLNAINFKQLQEFGFSEKDAAGILAFRKKLGGFINKEQILETYEIDKSLAKKLVDEAQLINSEVAKYTLSEAPESWLKNHPYFRYYADRIIYYRISYPDDKKIIKFLKPKPEYEAKMRLYLK